MARAGEVLTNPDGEQLTFIQTAADTNGDLLEMEVTYIPHSPQPPQHYHPNQEETFTVLAGTFEVSVDGDVHTHPSGETFVVPAGARHWMRNISDEEGRLSWQVRPALDSESFFETMWNLIENGETSEGATMDLLQVALIAREFSREFRLARPSYTMQRIVFAILAPFARRRGYRARYSSPGSAQ